MENYLTAASTDAQNEPMSKVDTTWLRMEQPDNLMMITGFMVFSDPLDPEKFRDVIINRLLAFRRFRQKAVRHVNGARWEMDKNFDLDTHIRKAALPGASGKIELEAFVSDLASTPLDPTRPLWQFHLIENYQGGHVLVTRFHHCIADGIALIQVLLSLTDDAAEQSERKVNRQSYRKRKATEHNLFNRLIEPAREGIDLITHMSKLVVQEGTQLLQHPDKLRDYAEEAGAMGKELLSLLALPDDPETVFKGPMGSRKRVAWADSIPLNEVKAACASLDCTVNDLLIAAVSGAINSWLIERGEDLEAMGEIRATVPVNLRPLEHALDLGNHFGLVFLSLPVDESNPLARIAKIHERMVELKSSHQAQVSLGVMATLGLSPAWVQKPFLDAISQKASAVLTNVPGPKQALYMAGTKVEEMMFWVPQNGEIGMGISILSYNDNVYFGLITDKLIVSDPEDIINRFRPEFEKILYLALNFPELTHRDHQLVESLMWEQAT
ncbi:MAG: wax ester/triacylglycerol synthase family O-acyltransferase [Proteobacteria bacterium]|nr:wax ester/triacylglycerol synthase family O-acyltransferase [Pseudomonadota bacterium]